VLTVTTSSITSHCAACGHEYEESTRFCSECGAPLSNGRSPAVDYSEPVTLPAPVALPRNRTFDLLAQQRAPFWLALVAAAVMVIGALGSWATALNIVSVSGTRGDGWLVIGAALIGVASLWGCVRRRSLALGSLAVLCGIAGAAVSVIDLNKLLSVKSVNFFGQQLSLMQPGWGIYADVGASVAFAALVGALLIWWRPTETPSPQVLDKGAVRTPGLDQFIPVPPQLQEARTIVGPPSPLVPPPVGRPKSDRGALIALVVAACLVLVVLGVALYVSGVFNSTSSSQPSTPAPAPTVPQVTNPTPTTPAQQPTTPAPQPNAAQTPASALRSHLNDLESGDYQAAFRLMSAGYRSQNPSWPSDRAAADPGINIILVGAPQYGSAGAQVPVDFYARDRNPTQGSDTQCREFQGTASMLRESGAWRYDPSGNSLTGTVVPSSDPNCPS
jgi:hypothetical protein